MGGLTNFPTLVAGKEWHGRSRCPGRAAHKIERRFRGCEMWDSPAWQASWTRVAGVIGLAWDMTRQGHSCLLLAPDRHLLWPLPLPPSFYLVRLFLFIASCPFCTTPTLWARRSSRNKWFSWYVSLGCWYGRCQRHQFSQHQQHQFFKLQLYQLPHWCWPCPASTPSRRELFRTVPQLTIEQRSLALSCRWYVHLVVDQWLLAACSCHLGSRILLMSQRLSS